MRLRLLLIDDDEKYRQGCRRALSEAGLEVTDCSETRDVCGVFESLELVQFDLVVLGMASRPGLAEHYAAAGREITAQFEKRGQRRPPLLLAVGAADPRLIAVAGQLEAAVVDRRPSDLDSASTQITLSMPHFAGIHTCEADECTPGGDVEEILLGNELTRVRAAPLARTPRIYFDYLCRNIDPARPRTAEYIARDIMERPFYRAVLENQRSNKRTVIENFHRIVVGLETLEADGNLRLPAKQIAVSTTYRGKETVYAIRCHYRVVHPKKG